MGAEMGQYILQAHNSKKNYVDSVGGVEAPNPHLGSPEVNKHTAHGTATGVL